MWKGQDDKGDCGRKTYRFLFLSSRCRCLANLPVRRPPPEPVLCAELATMKGKCTWSVHAARTLVCDINIFYFLFFISVLFDFGVETSCDCVLTPKKVAAFHLQYIAGGCVQWLRVICPSVQSVLTTSSNFALMPTCNPPTCTLTQRKCTREKRASLVCVGRMSRGIAYATKSLSGGKVTCECFFA